MKGIFKKIISKIKKIEIRKEFKIQKTENLIEPKDPSCLPKNPEKNELISGKNINNKYISEKIGFEPTI